MKELDTTAKRLKYIGKVILELFNLAFSKVIKPLALSVVFMVIVIAFPVTLLVWIFTGLDSFTWINNQLDKDY